LQQYRTEFAQRGEKDVTYLEIIRSNGADTVELSAAEMKQLTGMIENPHIHEGLLMALEACPEAIRTLFAWITEAWRNTVPDMDMSSVEVEAVQWRNLDNAMKLVRKVGILYKVYHPEIRTPLGTPVSRDMKKIIINGAPAHLKIILTTALA
jgi:hypothetical protein